MREKPSRLRRWGSDISEIQTETPAEGPGNKEAQGEGWVTGSPIV